MSFDIDFLKDRYHDKTIHHDEHHVNSYEFFMHMRTIIPNRSISPREYIQGFYDYIGDDISNTELDELLKKPTPDHMFLSNELMERSRAAVTERQAKWKAGRL